ncbi:hypothetical protein H9Y04_40775 [Streptomyces sp. TRM66268-LWL]|uniref:Uncharacterized protein n=1 Tax=Streptomyces polyasparticus TaxID=2767826 RepID=A0ABR7STR3_9ACTN|nr:daptide-type RiPP [Streptomyces polyasparticus]MBC9718882.1 hypothetical protein [Streptomyces polyasparticus]
MTEQKPTADILQADPLDAAKTELEMQELEPLEAPGFWTGVSIGTAVSASVVIAT